MRVNEIPEEVVQHLTRLIRGYNGTVKEGTAAKLRARASGVDPKHDEVSIMMDQAKGKLARMIEKELVYWDIWTEWMQYVEGVGPWIAGELIRSFYYKMVPVCKTCGAPVEKREVEGVNTFFCPECSKSIKGDGNLVHRVDIRTWKSISAWWKYMGRHVGKDGKMPKRRKGQQSDWSTHGRTVTYHLGESFNKRPETHLYKAYLLERKRYREKTHPEASQGYRHNMSKNETVKLFLSHFFIVACQLEGWEVPNPYSIQIMNHTGYIPPFYWVAERKAA